MPKPYERIPKKEDKQEWLDQRREGIGGSDAAACCGMSPFTTRLELYYDKTGEKPIDLPDSQRLEWGTTLEPVIRQKYAEETGRKIGCPKFIFRSRKHPFMQCNIDGWIMGERGMLEIKTADKFTASYWGEPGTDRIPKQYYIQVTHMMAVCDMLWCDVAVLIGGNDFRIYHVPLDKKLRDVVVSSERDFWECVQNRTPPDCETLEDFKLRWPDPIPAKEHGATTLEPLRLYNLTKNSRNKAEEQVTKHKVDILNMMQDATILTYDGRVVAKKTKSNALKVEEDI